MCTAVVYQKKKKKTVLIGKFLNNGMFVSRITRGAMIIDQLYKNNIEMTIKNVRRVIILCPPIIACNTKVTERALYNVQRKWQFEFIALRFKREV